jgi:hypothetical protein
MGGLGGARRRLLRWFGAVGVLTLAVPVWQMIANASVTNSGNVSVAMATTIHAADFDIGPVNLSSPAAGTITSTGLLTIPAANMKFGSRHVEDDLDIVGDTQTLGYKAASAFTGTVNPTDGTVTLSGKLNLVFAASGGDDLVDDSGHPYSIKCTSPAFNVSLSTANGGTPYNQTTGKATVASTGLNIAELPVAAPGCGGWEDDVNFGLDLPASSSDPVAYQTTLSVGLTFTPVIHGPTTTAKSPTSLHGGSSSSSSVPGSSTPTTNGGGGGPTTVNTTTPTTRVTPTTHGGGGGPTTIGTTTPTTRVTPTTTHGGGPTTTLAPPGVTTTTWPQHCTDGDPTRCHDTHHPHTPSH